MIELIKKLYYNSVIRYIFFGGCTTLVNLVTFYILRKPLGLELQFSNITSIVVAVIFAYIVNSKFVFMDKCNGIIDHIKPFCKFVGARAITMIIEIVGVWFLVEQIKLLDMFGKIIVNIIVVIVNYIFSKFYVFTTNKVKKEKENEEL